MKSIRTLLDEQPHLEGCLYIVNVEGVVLRAGGQVALIRRSLKERHAAGQLSLPGGKVEGERGTQNVLEETLRREVLEEIGVQVAAEMVYLESRAFVTDDGKPVVDVVFACRWLSGELCAVDADEVAGAVWLPLKEAVARDDLPPWTRASLVLAASRLQSLQGWAAWLEDENASNRQG